MKLLFDQNLSRHLVGLLSDEYPDSQHVVEVGLAFLNGPPPKAVWPRLGNASTSEICAALRSNQDVMVTFSESEGEALLVIGSDEVR